MKNEIHYLEAVSNYLGSRVIDLNADKGYVPGGINGPYFDVETPVRNSAHALIIFSFLYRHTGDNFHRDKAKKMAAFLLDPRVFRSNGTYIHRQKSGKDWCNGVIGQAWVIEALNTASYLLRDDQLRSAAQDAANVFSFDQKIKAWKAEDPGAKTRKIDYTLNHQLWYAASIAEVSPDTPPAEVASFLDHLADFGLQVRQNGLINHQFYGKSLKSKALRTRYEFAYRRNPTSIAQKEIGYHLYNLFPLARLFKIYPTHPLFSSSKFIATVHFAQSDAFLDALTNNKYAFPYNSPTFEFPLIIKTFKSFFKQEKIDLIENYIWSHVNLIRPDKPDSDFTSQKELLINGDQTNDPITLIARSYELVFSLLDP